MVEESDEDRSGALNFLEFLELMARRFGEENPELNEVCTWRRRSFHDREHESVTEFILFFVSLVSLYSCTWVSWSFCDNTGVVYAEKRVHFS